MLRAQPLYFALQRHERGVDDHAAEDRALRFERCDRSGDGGGKVGHRLVVWAYPAVAAATSRGSSHRRPDFSYSHPAGMQNDSRSPQHGTSDSRLP